MSLQSIDCPLCGNQVEIHQSSDPNECINKHMDRCSRKTRNVRSNDSVALPNEDDDLEGELASAREGESENTSLSATQLSKKSRLSRPSKPALTSKMRSTQIEKQNSGLELFDCIDSAFGDRKNCRVSKNRIGGPALEAKESSTKTPDDYFESAVSNNYDESDDVDGEKEHVQSFNDNSSDIGNYATEDDAGQVSEHVRVHSGLILDDWEDAAYDARLAALPALQAQFQPLPETAKCSLLQQQSESAETYVSTEYGGEYDSAAWSRLYEYQREGCRWLRRMYRDGVGGILADEMGLGKTAQLCVHFGSLARDYAHSSSISMSTLSPSMNSPNETSSSSAKFSSKNRYAGPVRIPLRKREEASSIFLVVCPATVIHHWLRELHVWAPLMRCVVLHSISATGGELSRLGEQSIRTVLRRLQRLHNTHALTVLSTYEGLRAHKSAFCAIEWTAVCLDEGHKIRNPNAEITQISKQLPCYHRLILSGTPIQNSLTELWSLFDFIYPGRLGSLAAFQAQFCDPIKAGGYVGATALKIEIATRTAGTLQRIVRPFLLRRRKDQVQLSNPLPTKTEHVIFCKLSSKQRSLYNRILDSPEVEAVIQNRIVPFRALNALRKLCNHPSMLTADDTSLTDTLQEKLKRNKLQKLSSKIRNPSSSVSDKRAPISRRDDFQRIDCERSDSDSDGASAIYRSASLKWEDSGKLLVLRRILPEWFRQGHKVLLFSQTRTMLNILERLLSSDPDTQFKYMRLDGSTPVGRREGIISRFNTDPTVFLILLTTRTGGVGISLTGADRVVLLDPDWNPQTDLQARERAWRLGQTRPVTVYRLLTRGTIEEKIYERQIIKIMLSNRVLAPAGSGMNRQKPLFAKSLLKELFTLSDRGYEGAEMDLPLPPNGYIDGKELAREAHNTHIENISCANQIGQLNSSRSIHSNNHQNTLNICNNLDRAGSTNNTNHSSSQALSNGLYNGDLFAYHDVEALKVLMAGDGEMEGDSAVVRDGDDFGVTASDMFSSAVIIPLENADHDLEESSVLGQNAVVDGSNTQAAALAAPNSSRLQSLSKPLEPGECESDLETERENNKLQPRNSNGRRGDITSRVFGKINRCQNGTNSYKCHTLATASYRPEINKRGLLGKTSIANSLLSSGPVEKPDEFEPTQLNDDREVLKLLFSDKAIASVFDHDHLEMEGSARKSQVILSATQHVSRALQSVQSSATVYIPQKLSHSQSQIQIQSLETSSSSIKTERFQVLGVSSGPSTSAGLLANIRKRQKEDSAAKTLQGSTDADDSVGIRECICQRLEKLFDQYGSRLRTQFIVRCFSDLGNQYAALFRTCLQKCATRIDGGYWLRKLN